MICKKCGHKIVKRNGKYVNCTKENGSLVHIKCPKDKKPTKDQEDLKKLKEAVLEYFTTNPKGYIKDNERMSMSNVNKTIKELKKIGYSYEEQLYTLDFIVKKQNGFYGYGAVKNNIESVISRKRIGDSIKHEDHSDKFAIKRWENKDEDFDW